MQTPALVDRPVRFDPAAAVAERTVLGRVGRQFMHHQREDGESLRCEKHLRPGQPDPLGLGGQVGAGLRHDQGTQRGRPPIVGGDLVVGTSQRLDPTGDDGGELLHRLGPAFALAHQRANEAEDVADPVVQFGDQQFLPLAGLAAGTAGDVGQPQHHLQQGHPQRFGCAQVNVAPGPGPADHRLLPGLEALARSQARAVGTILRRLRRVAAPGDGAYQFLAEEDQIIARRARHRDRQQAAGAFGEVAGRRMDRSQMLAGIDHAGWRPVQEAHDAKRLLTRRGLALQMQFAVDATGEAVALDQPPQFPGKGDQAFQRAIRCRRAST